MSFLLLICQSVFSETFEVTETERLGFYEQRGFSLFRSNGKTIGYKIASDSRFYQAVGLKVGDIVTHINGHNLSEVEGVVASMPLMKSADVLEYKYIEELGGEEKTAIFEFTIKIEAKGEPEDGADA